MPAEGSLNVSLTQELEQFVRERVDTGRYATSSEVVRDALRLLQRHELETEERIKVIKAQLKRGSNQADVGTLIDGSTVIKQARDRIEGKHVAQVGEV